MSEQLSAYVDPALLRRMERIRKRRPRLSLSRQVEAALVAHLPAIEAEAGIKTHQRMP